MPTFAGLGKALQVGAQGVAAHQSAKERRSTFQRQVAEDKLATSTAQAQNTPEKVQESVDAVSAQNRGIIAKQAKSETFAALRSYDADSNTKHLNNMLKNSPQLRKLYGNVVSVEKINPAADQALLVREGLDPGAFSNENIDNQAFLHRILKVTNPDGSQRLVDMQQIMIGTGYSASLTQQDLEASLKRSQIEKNLRGQKGVDPVIQRETEYLAGKGLGTEEEIAGKLYTHKVAGVTPAKLEIASAAEDSLNTMFGDKFFETDFSDRGNRVRASKAIREMEQAGGEELSAADRTDLKDINVLIASGTAVADDLSPEATGILDNLTSNVEKYMSDEKIEHTTGRAAYNAYRNALLRAFGGTAMSDAEVKNFNAAFGTLAQKYPAVLSQFKQAIEQTKAKLETISRVNNPYLAHYYLGTSQDELDSITTRLDRNLDMLSTHGRAAPPGEPQAPAQPAWKKLWEQDK